MKFENVYPEYVLCQAVHYISLSPSLPLLLPFIRAKIQTYLHLLKPVPAKI